MTDEVANGTIREIKAGTVRGTVGMCTNCAERSGVAHLVTDDDDEIDAMRQTVCISCGTMDDICTLPVDADFAAWDPVTDGRWDAPPWYLNPRVNLAIKQPEGGPRGQMVHWMNVLNM